MKNVNLWMAIVALLVASSVFSNHGYADINPADIAAVWLADEGSGKTLDDSEGQGINGTINGAKWVNGIRGKALQYDGKSAHVFIPDSAHINTGGPYTNRTIMALFNCDDVSIKDPKQTIFEEGGRTRGIVIYVHEGNLYVGAWNRAEYNWDGAWLSTPIESGRWYYVALVLRDVKDKVEKDKFEMWLDGELIAKAPGGQLHGHSNDNAIGGVIENTVFHDEDGSGNGHYFGGIIDEVRLYNASLTQDDLDAIWGNLLPVEPVGRLTTLWAKVKE